MIISFSHAGLSKLYVIGRVGALQTDVDRRCIAILDLLASLRAEEPLPQWLQPACIPEISNGYCVPVSSGLFLAFARDGAEISGIRLISATFEAPNSHHESPACIERHPTHPGIIFRTLFLPSSDLSLAAIGRVLGAPEQLIYKFTSGNRRAAGDFATGIAALTKTSVDFWLRLQSAHDVSTRWRGFAPHIPLAAILSSIEGGPRMRQMHRISMRTPTSRAV